MLACGLCVVVLTPSFYRPRKNPKKRTPEGVLDPDEAAVSFEPWNLGSRLLAEALHVALGDR
jgi:hypothetical protein